MTELHITKTENGYKCEAVHISKRWFFRIIKTCLVGTYPTSLDAYQAGAKQLKWKEINQPWVVSS